MLPRVSRCRAWGQPCLVRQYNYQLQACVDRGIWTLLNPSDYDYLDLLTDLVLYPV